MRILQLSDTHLERTDAPNKHGVNAHDSLRLLLADLRHQQGIDAVVVTGDLANDGAVEAYTALRDMVGEFAEELGGAPVFYTTGNHDERDAFAKVLGSGHPEPDAVLDGPERAAVSVVDGWRIVTLDSLVPGKVHGELSAGQLDWLRGVLATPADRGSILALHHPPIALDNPLQQALGLRNPAALADAVRGSDVRVVLTGHFHLQLLGFIGESVPVWVTPGIVSRVDLATEPGAERAVRGASASLVQLGGASGPLFHTFHARDPRAHEAVYELDAEEVRTVVDLHG